MMLPDPAQALNDLERVLLAARQGECRRDDVLTALLAADVVILLDRDPGPDDLGNGIAVPMLLNNQQGRPVLAVFSAAERSIPMALQFPQFGFALPVAFRELLKVMRPGIGLVVNPGTATALEMPAETVAEMLQDALLL